jgi:hypothetical protein
MKLCSSYIGEHQNIKHAGRDLNKPTGSHFWRNLKVIMRDSLLLLCRHMMEKVFSLEI